MKKEIEEDSLVFKDDKTAGVECLEYYEHDEGGEESSKQHGWIRLPLHDEKKDGKERISMPPVTSPSHQRTRIVENECAICLDSLSIGEVVIWSNNIHCRHAFHQDCILEYLVRLKDQKFPCPCCRQSFCVETKKNPRK